MTIREALFQLLTGAGGVGNSPASAGALAASIGSRVYPVLVDASKPYPKVAYQQLSGPREYALDGAAGLASARFQITVFGDLYATAVSAKELIRANVSGFRGSVGTIRINFIELTSEQDVFYPQAETRAQQEFGIQFDAMIMFNE